MKFLFYYYKFRPDNPNYKTQAVSFKAHAQDLIRGLEQLGHEVRELPIVDTLDEEKVAVYESYKPDWVVTVESWKSHLVTSDHARRHGLAVAPYLVSDGWVSPKYATLLNELPFLIVPSEWVKSVFRRDGVTKPDIRIVKESVDTVLFAPARDQEKVLAWRRAKGIQDHEIMVLTIGGEICSKGGLDVIKAMEKLGRKDIKFVAKTSPTNPGTERDKAVIAESPVKDQVVYFQDIIPAEEVVLMMQACDIYAAPSRNEGFGRPHVEAQACGKPVITLNGSAAKENVKHMETGYVTKVGKINQVSHDSLPDLITGEQMDVTFDPPIDLDFLPDIDDLAHGLELLCDPVRRQTMGQTAREFAVATFATDVITKQFLEALHVQESSVASIVTG